MHNKVLKTYFGYDNFREGQEHIIKTILNGKDVLGVMPTGAGKSMCFQIPALILKGITLVVSPLISLMKDQVLSLNQSGIKAAFINSSLTMAQYNLAINRARQGEYKLVYISPERLETPSFLEFVKAAEISMIAVDEAHCISQWGNDFRPSYLKIPEFINSFETRPVVCAFTATATKQVQQDIVQGLCLKEPEVLVTGFDRKNLYFEVKKPKNKLQELIGFLKTRKAKTGIIYCTTRKNVDTVHEKLHKEGFLVTKYHAGLSDEERKQNQEDFIFDVKTVIVATNAFGMGIDKSNVSYVIHYNMPKDMESYYQEAGRAGRDGQDAVCILYYSPQDVRTNLFLIEKSRENETADEESVEEIINRDKDRLKQMTFYCNIQDCLRGFILKYFGEKPAPFCKNCSSCLTNFETKDVTTDVQKILSCVKRTGEYYGATLIVDVLKGSKSEKVVRFRTISTYGIMAKQTSKYIRDIINNLTWQGYLQSTQGEYPVLKLTEKANEVLFNGEKVMLKVNISDKKEKPTTSEEINQGLFDSLATLRKKLAYTQGVPAFVVFSDATLKDMCGKLPKDEEGFLSVSGVGQVKYNRYGKEFLKVIGDYLGGE